MAHNKDKVLIATKKAKSLMDKVLNMIESDQYCINVIQQNLAIIGLLRSANLSLLDGHINNCVKTAVQEKNTGRLNEMMEELVKVMKVAQTK